MDYCRFYGINKIVYYRFYGIYKIVYFSTKMRKRMLKGS